MPNRSYSCEIYLEGENSVKRLLDLSISVLVLVLFLPLGILIGAAIYVIDPGPIFYRQERVGQGGRKFRLWKFRTMMVQQPVGSGHITYGTRDPRITPLGYYLRMLKLDEVPQLINVIKGYEFSRASAGSDKVCGNVYRGAKRILELRPGCTDITVLYGHFHDAALLENQQDDPESFYINVLMPKKIKHNLFYLENQSLWLDMKILIGTALLMLRIRQNKPMTEGLSVMGFFS